jgi:hypothetical protein
MESNIKDVLFEQLRLLARRSDEANVDENLVSLTDAMCAVARLLDESARADRARADCLAQQERENKFFNR